MIQDVMKQLMANQPALWDGGMGAMLLAAGLEQGKAPETWNIERPDIVAEIHRAYFDAGSDVIQTNTFGGGRARLLEAKCPYSCEEINAEAVKIALQVRPQGKFVAGDLGPSGLLLPPVGKGEEKQIEEIFGEQSAILSSCGVDLLSLETISDLREARAALRAIKRQSKLPVIVSMTFRETRRGFFTIMGDPAAASLNQLLDDGADVVGANCTLSSSSMALLAKELKAKVHGPLLLQPNAGNPMFSSSDANPVVLYPEGPEAFASFTEHAMSLGVEIIGGCCGTTPEYIKAMDCRRKTIRHG